jgi:NADPH-dependent 2,4-dienoyl-CoA reductase/sulfur reductase-like enzyme
MKLLIIGGSDAGIAAALRARELSKDVSISLLLADEFPNFSICGLPFYVSGETPNWRDLAHRTEFSGIEVLTNHTATAILPTEKIVQVTDSVGAEKPMTYDQLIIGTGARPIVPDLPGVEHPLVFPLHTMHDSFRLHDHITERRPRSAVIVGSGYIGLEMADALVHRGLTVAIVGRSPAVLPTVDSQLGRLIEDELRRKGVQVVSGAAVERLTDIGGRIEVSGAAGAAVAGEIMVLAVGVRPNSELGAAAGIPVGSKGALCVDRHMGTNVESIYAAGDCVETWHRILRANTWLPLGTTSHKQGRVAGENAIGGNREFQGSLGTQVVKVFELAVGRTGLRDSEATAGGFESLTTFSEHDDHKAYYPGARKLLIAVTGDRGTGKLLGAQIVGHWQSEVAKRIDVFASALHHGMAVEALNDLDLSYTPPLGSPWDAVQMAAQEWVHAFKGAASIRGGG